MHDQKPRVSTRDLADPTHARRSLRASLDRRVRLARRRRATSGGRRAIVAATCLLAIGGAGGAMAQETTKTSTSSAKKSASTAGYDVKALQRKLGIKADGVVGPQTRRAIKRFQKRNGLKADGIVGPATLEALGLSEKAEEAAPEDGAAPADEEGTPTASGSKANQSEVAAHLEKIAQCESGGDPTAVSPDGKYRGKYQFLRDTWEAVGGSGDPAEAPESEQDLRAAALYEKQGPNAWPVCSKQS